MSEPIVIGKVERSGGFVQVAITAFKNRAYLDIRYHVENEKGAYPTKKGVTIPLDDFEELKDIINSPQMEEVIAAIRVQEDDQPEDEEAQSSEPQVEETFSEV